MAVDMFLKIDGIPGESTDASHKDEIDIFSYTWGESQPETAAAGPGGLSTGKTTMQDFHFVMRVRCRTQRVQTVESGSARSARFSNRK